ncbi:Transcriptional regulator, AraC family [Alkalibacterium sp. AK22]|uniref:AraC family transcriptional regulator n=1 Tax=Alkalibacterium sp. AK22 TaxID=1229520 RepID=UPI000446EEA0|nr:AraC family transcriptional regulator [Alkalibacterium sp. AK22]EXJ23724.1 Transcriptional regulator, AraC family [Alkalibacterium sp. AK22]
MNDLYHMNQAMQYIEDHLEENIESAQLAKIAMTSETYFKRLFSFLSGMSLQDYIRKRRFTQAAFELKESDVKVIDLAFKYGYTSPDAFTKAFQHVHGLTPTQARELNSSLLSYPRLTFRLDIEGGTPMKYRLVEKESFIVAGYQTEATIGSEGESEEILEFLSSLTEDNFDRLNNISNGQFDGKQLFVSSDVTGGEKQSSQNFYVGVPVDTVPADLNSITITKQLWAVFTIKGEWDAVNDAWSRIYTEWFPSSTFEPASSPEFMISKDNESEVWVAVKKK